MVTLFNCVLISSWSYLWLKIIKHCVGSLSSGDEVGTRAGNGQFPATRRSVQALITKSLHNIYRYYLFIIHVNSYCTVLPLDISVGIKNITIVREKYNFFLLQCDTILWELFTSAKRQCGHFPTSAKIIQKIILHLKFLLLRSVFS